MSRERRRTVAAWILATLLGASDRPVARRPRPGTPSTPCSRRSWRRRSRGTRTSSRCGSPWRRRGTRPDQAGALADPMVVRPLHERRLGPDASASSIMTNARRSWSRRTLPWPGKRGVRAAIAATDEGQVEQQALERGRLAMAAAVRRAYYGLLLARETLELVAEQEQDCARRSRASHARATRWGRARSRTCCAPRSR